MWHEEGETTWLDEAIRTYWQVDGELGQAGVWPARFHHRLAGESAFHSPAYGDKTAALATLAGLGGAWVDAWKASEDGYPCATAVCGPAGCRGDNIKVRLVAEGPGAEDFRLLCERRQETSRYDPSGLEEITEDHRELVTLSKTSPIVLYPAMPPVGQQITQSLRLLPVDIDYVFGYAPSDQLRVDLIYHLDQMKPVFKDIKPDTALFAFKGYPQGVKDASAKDSKLWVVRVSTSGAALKTALSSTPYVIFSGHSNMGLGPIFDEKAATTTGDFINFGNPQVAINYKWMVRPIGDSDGGDGFINLQLPDNEVAGTVANYWVLPGKLGQVVDRFQNKDEIKPPNPFHFAARAGKAKNQGLHFNRDDDADEFVIVNIPQAALAEDMVTLGCKAFFYNSCSTVMDYADIFAGKGPVFIGSNKATSAWKVEDKKFVRYSQTDFIFAQRLMAGDSWQEIIKALNDECFDVGDGNNALRLIE